MADKIIQKTQDLHQLPTKITVMVFWLLVIMGSAASIVIINNNEWTINKHLESIGDKIALHIMVKLHNPYKPASSLKAAWLEGLRKQFNVAGLKVVIGSATLTSGQVGGGLEELTRSIPIHPVGDVPENTTEVAIGIFHQPKKNLIQSKQKHVLLTMGAFCLLCGLFMAWMLRKIITKPFREMIDTVNKISNGDTTLRFKAQRQDEFGYLESFINKALDSLIQQTEKVTKALDHAKQTEAELFIEKEKAQVTLFSLTDAVITGSKDGKIEYMNPVAVKLTGWPTQTCIGEPLERVLTLVRTDEDGSRNWTAEALGHTQTRITAPDTLVLIDKSDDRIPVHASASKMYDSSGQLTGTVFVIRDVSKERRLVQKMTYQATHDSLSGLLNRMAFEKQLHEAIESAQQQHARHTLCYLDLDQFKIVNDTCGHMAGDELIRQLSQVLAKTVREGDVLARLGGDEFGILLHHCDINHAYQVAEKIRRAVDRFRFGWENKHFEVGVSIGLVETDTSIIDAHELLSRADIACYAAKDKGRNRIHVFYPDDEESRKKQGEMRCVTNIKHALNNNDIILYCQPVVNTQNAANEILYYEILARMRSPDGTIAAPASFLPAAERYALMPAIDKAVVSQTLAFLSRFQQGFPLKLGVNLSGQTLCDNVFLEFVLEQMKHFNSRPEQLIFEFTETSAVSNIKYACEYIDRLHTEGCRFALDDFGTGFSSFAYLKDLKVDYLKIDGHFVVNAVKDPVSKALVESMHTIGDIMGMETIAEYIENDAILDLVQSIGIPYAQGYFIEKPFPLERLAEDVAGTPLQQSDTA